LQSIPFKNSYIKLGGDFYVATKPTPVREPELIKFNQELAQQLGLIETVLNSPDATDIFAGNRIPIGAEPLAMAYAGHQFGGFSPQLGDGRAILLGEIISPDGIRYDLQLKGSGRTFYSRGGDGRAALGPILREYLVSEAMAALGVPTTRALAAVTTGEDVARMQLLPGGVLTRIASSFIRVGTFQYFSARGDLASIKRLADTVIARNYPQLVDANNPYSELLQAVVERQASLIAQWMQLGFIHGVMNTDNMSIAGETIDYGPCAFMDAYDHDQVFSSIDHQKRYAYSNQPAIGLWNLTRLAECLVPLFNEDHMDKGVEIAETILNTYSKHYEHHWLNGMRAKIGLLESHQDDKELIDDLFDIMAVNHADFTLTFYYLSQLKVIDATQDDQIRDLFADSNQFDHWVIKWRKRLSTETANEQTRHRKMQAVNPVYIPRNHQIEKAIRAAEDQGDFSLFHQLHQVLKNPYQVQQGEEAYTLPPESNEIVKQTFCGT
jgi:uncharacterized protein YdiU (UPF0061 family)